MLPNADSTSLLKDAVRLDEGKILNPQQQQSFDTLRPDVPVLVLLAAGKGTRFGTNPKCIQPVQGVPLARHSIDAFHAVCPSPVICLVGYRHEEVAAALGDDNIYVQSENPAGGTALAAFEAFCVRDLLEKNPLLILSMGDRIIPSSIFHRLWETHRADGYEAALTFLSAIYEPPKNHGKGRVLRDENNRVLRIIEERDIENESDETTRLALFALTEGNCPLYMIRARTLHQYLENINNSNAQRQFYLTDIIENIRRDGGEIRTLTTKPADAEYAVLCADVTRPDDLTHLESVLAPKTELGEITIAARMIAAGRPRAQIASIVRQLKELLNESAREELPFKSDEPIAVGISGGRLRLAFMHPDMMRFYGPAWQMPIGAGREAGDEQIVMLVQSTEDHQIHLHPLNPKFRENINSLPSQNEVMYPGDHIADLHTYEEFGTRMSENLLLSLGYFSDAELNQRRINGQPLPPSSLWVSNNMRRPFTLVGNAIASLRTLRSGPAGERVQKALGKDTFQGLRIVTTGSIPQGGFSSSSAVTVATKNALNALYDLQITPDLLVHLACQAEYGTGVRAGSLDQATEQKGQAGQGTLISSNPQENYRTIGTYPVPAERFRIIFPYSVERDREAWRWSWGFYGESTSSGPLTTSEMRKLTGKAAEIAALIVGLPQETSFFQHIEEDLVTDGLLSLESRQWICSVLRQLPLLATQEELRQAVAANETLFSGWRDPILKRTTVDGEIVEEIGVPLRAIVAYLFCEVARNFYLIHHPESWIESVSLSQRGDRCLDIAPENLPSKSEMESEMEWERGCAGPQLLDLWLERHGATPFDYQRGLSDEELNEADPPDFRLLAGANFFRGLALIDLIEAMLKRAFGDDAVGVRVNAAGQGDYFQVHVDTQRVDVENVKPFLRVAFYRRFGFTSQPDFVEVHPGGGALGVRLSRYDALPRLIESLQGHR